MSKFDTIVESVLTEAKLDASKSPEGNKWVKRSIVSDGKSSLTWSVIDSDDYMFELPFKDFIDKFKGVEWSGDENLIKQIVTALMKKANSSLSGGKLVDLNKAMKKVVEKPNFKQIDKLKAMQDFGIKIPKKVKVS
tara:strand:+ start:278 stop:685 length:408 start_codon:yes stop_codon:yes gene_type:complete